MRGDDGEAGAILHALGYVPAAGEMFDYDILGESRSFQVTGWARRRQLTPGEQLQRELGIRRYGTWPDQTPLESCRREQAEYVVGDGTGRVIIPVCEVRVTGRAQCTQEDIDAER